METFEKIKLIDVEDYLDLPLAGVLATCGFTGFPSPATDYEERQLSLTEFLGIKKNTTWLFKSSGNSLSKLGIVDGDVLIVDTKLTPELDDLCICEVEGEYLAKVIQVIQGTLYLISADDQHKPVKLDNETRLQVFGVVTGKAGKIRRGIGKSL